jgi:hypothetical protein
MMHICYFFFFSDHCAILELGYLQSGKIAYPGQVRSGQVPDIPDKRSSTVIDKSDILINTHQYGMICIIRITCEVNESSGKQATVTS